MTPATGNVKITFGMIVLNGEPFLRYNLRSIYPWAHQIVVVEGACETSRLASTQDGHSTDGTLETLAQFQAHEDPHRKIVCVSARDEGFLSGFWPEKTEMCQAFSRRATGDYIWQVDSDEFYREGDMPAIVAILKNGVGQVSFPQYSFWGGPRYINNSLYLAEMNRKGIPRIFSWGPGHSYASHRPPIVLDSDEKNVSRLGCVSGRELQEKKIYMYHYCLVFPGQLRTKVAYYGSDSQQKTAQNGGFSPTIAHWYQTSFNTLQRPFHLHNMQATCSWANRFVGGHPTQVEKMFSHVADIQVQKALTHSQEAETLLNSRWYKFAALVLNVLTQIAVCDTIYPVFRALRGIVRRSRRILSFS